MKQFAIEKTLSRGTTDWNCLAYKPGDPVSIKTGVLAGLSGVFAQRSGKDRVVVLLEILGHQAQAAIPLAELDR